MGLSVADAEDPVVVLEAFLLKRHVDPGLVGEEACVHLEDHPKRPELEHLPLRLRGVQDVARPTLDKKAVVREVTRVLIGGALLGHARWGPRTRDCMSSKIFCIKLLRIPELGEVRLASGTARVPPPC